MNKFYLILFVFYLISCSKNESEYLSLEPESPVVVDLKQVPYAKLSDYHFFEGDLKNQIPSLNVLPYEPASSLFTDYALKKRFVWMPKSTKATFIADDKVLDLPVGAVLIKTFYYNKIQPNNTTKILETRLMIKKSTGWIFADYIWNDDQTEARFDLTGSYVNLDFKDDENLSKSVTYRIPNESQCVVCHKNKKIIDGKLVTSFNPIGIKPQNLNFSIYYKGANQNQLKKWVAQGYLENNFLLPIQSKTTVNYKDVSKSLDARARSYVDINCAHCHQDERHCDYRPLRFAFNETGGSDGTTKMGACVDTRDMQSFPSYLNKIITPGNIETSMLFYRINTVDDSYRMPLHGRTLIDTQGVTLMKDWINSLERCN